jgi:hypothetical protein
MNRSESARDKWARIIDEQQRSELAVSAFCRRRSVPASSFFAWRRKLAGHRARKFVEVAVARRVDGATDAADGRRAGGVTIELGGGRRRVTVTRPFDRELLLNVIDTLEGKPSTLEGKPSTLERRP